MPKYIFSVAVMANMLSMTAMLILLSIAGRSHLSADIGIVQAATSALFFAFSANARTVVLGSSNFSLAKSIFDIRTILFVPLALAAYWLTAILGGVEPYLAGILILRRVAEWLIEVDLSERERLGDKSFALTYIIAQALLFALAAFWLLMRFPYPLLGLFLWAFLPLLLSARFFWRALEDFAKEITGISKKMAPHFGSSFAIGVSLYVFRLLMIAMLGKNVSGDFFAAFAIGGVLGSIFVSAFGPSIAFNEKTKGAFKLPKLFKFTLWSFTGLGSLIFCISLLKPDLFSWSGKEIYFWQAVGLSMIGGVFMVHAQLLRNRLLVHNEHHDLWGPDLLMNVLVIAALPLATYWGGFEAVAGLSLLSALLALAFYKSSEFCEISRANKHIFQSVHFQIAVVLVVLVPVFITLNSGLFLASEIPLTGYTSLLLVPIPISIFFTYLAILLIGAYREVRFSIGMLFFSFILMVFTSLIVSDYQVGLNRTKLILIIQCILPMGAFILGEMFNKKGLDAANRIEKAFLYVLVTLVPLQLVASWIQGGLTLTGYLYIFSIYQYLDYVPIVFVSAYLLALFSLWQEDRYRNVLFALSPLMGIYAAASLTLSAIIFLLLGVFVFAFARWRWALEKLPTSLFIVVLASSLGYLSIEMSAVTAADKFSASALEIVSAWQFYAGEIFDNVQSLFLGHAEGVDRIIFASAHNYLLDMVRNFGLVSIIPVLVVFGYTVRAAYSARRYFYKNLGLLGCLAVLTYLLVIDNATQVSLRQPYSGVYTFFLWGLLIARLSQLSAIDRQQAEPVEYRR